jgi:hypothetical protein
MKNKNKKILKGLAALEALGTNIPWQPHQLRNSTPPSEKLVPER